MTDPSPFRIRLFAGGLFAVALAVWTWKLLEPNPVPEGLLDVFGSWADFLGFVAAKSVHAGGYAFLAFLGCVWPPTPRGRFAVLVFLILHGAGTEIGQTFVPNRSGTVRDVVIDWLGITAGFVAWRRFVRPT